MPNLLNMWRLPGKPVLSDKRTFECASTMSALPPKADIFRSGVDVR